MSREAPLSSGISRRKTTIPGELPAATRGIESSPGVPKELIKSCTSIFFLLSEDYEFEKDTLIQLWMAGGTITNEDDGESCFNYFLEKECIFCHETNFVTGVDSYKMNIQKMHDKLEHQGDESRFYLKWDNGNQDAMSSETKHVSLVCDDTHIAAIFQALSSSKDLKTLIFLGDYGRVTHVPDHLFLSLEELQVLDLSRTRVEKVPSSIRCMTRLRYLDPSWTPIEHLPDAVCFLNELQTLKLEGCSNLSRLPEQTKLLTALRHLHIDVLRQLSVMPQGLGSLENLQTLSAFMVGGGCRITELKKLNKLTGNFCIAMLEHVKSGYEAGEAALSRKNQIKKLELKWSMSCSPSNTAFSVLDALQPSPSLEELKISCYGGSKFPNWVGNPNFERLVGVTFFDCRHLLELPPLECLPALKSLSLVKMNRIRKISRLMNVTLVAFPRLEKLSVIEMAALETWDWKEANEGDFKCLVELVISGCPELREMGVLRHLPPAVDLEVSGCPKLSSQPDFKVEHVPSGEIRRVDDYEGSYEGIFGGSLCRTRSLPRESPSLPMFRAVRRQLRPPRSVNPALPSFMKPTASSKIRDTGSSAGHLHQGKPGVWTQKTMLKRVDAGSSAPKRLSGSVTSGSKMRDTGLSDRHLPRRKAKSLGSENSL